MLWHDFFYFSKGERSGFIILLSIIVIAGTILFLNKNSGTASRDTQGQETSAGRNPTTLTSNDSVSLERNDAQTTNVNSQTTSTSSASTSSNALSGSPSTSSKPTTSSSGSTSSSNSRESVAERVNRLTSYSQPTYTRTEKLAEGTIVELNTADTTLLKKVPGIGSAFANRIVNYRTILRGYHSVTQLSEVYGIDEERYMALQPWFTVDPSHINKIEINKMPQDSLQRHPYINYAQARVIVQLRRQKGKLTGWENIQLLNEFTDFDKIRLQPYLSFE